jgi:hypothetical protein
MSNAKIQMKFKIDPEVANAFKIKCSAECVSMSSVVQGWMNYNHQIKDVNVKYVTRPQRRKAVMEILLLLNSVLENEEQYRDSIPEQFAQRYEIADHSCGMMTEAIAILEEAF